MQFDPANLDMTPAEQERARAWNALLESARNGDGIAEQAAAGGMTVRHHHELRQGDPRRMAEWLAATAVGCELAREEVQGKRKKRAAGMASLVLTKSEAIQREVKANPEAFVEALRAQVRDDPGGFMSETMRDAAVVDKMASGVFGLDKPGVEVNVQNNLGVAITQGNLVAPDRPAETMEDFIARDLGIPIAWIRPRALWILRRADCSDVKQLVMIVGKGGSKTNIAAIMLARQCQRLLVLPDPAAHYGQMPGSLVGVINMSASGKDQAQLAIFGELRRHIKNAPWFRRDAVPDGVGEDGLPGTASSVKWAGKNVIAFCGNSQSEGAEGISFIAAAVDEVCRLPESGPNRVLTADSLINPVRETMVTRFGGARKAILMSWPAHREDFLHREKAAAIASGIAEDMTTEFLASPLVAAGGAAEADRRDALKQAPFNDAPTEVFIARNGTMVIHAPLWQIKPDCDLAELREEWERRPGVFACQVAARPLAEVENSFFRDPEIVREKANSNREHPIRPDGTFEEWFRGSPNNLYYGHIDVGVSKDSAGISVGHPDSGRTFYDLMLEIVPPSGGEISLESLRQVLYAMQARGFTFALVTCDGFEGISMRQEINGHGITCENYSVDKSREAYDTWSEELRTGMLDYYPYDPLFRNAKSLVDLGKKIDHSRTGSKDVTDAAAAVAVHCKQAGGSRIGSFT